MIESVLVLNANFEPVNICNTRRAICLILMEKANLVLNGRGVIRTVNYAYPRPSIIRLQRMIHRPRPKVKLTRKEILRRDNFTCQYCGARSKHLTIDHIIPRHLGGKYEWTNVVTACSVCNHRKGGRTLNQASMHLSLKPKSPPSSATYIFSRHLSNYIDWEPYLTGW
ncbi:MAG TPA: HNH endonuclease [Anaerolineae bacterium]|nr:HNH endonuclease [Anaerolineae bacterium]